MDTKSRTHARNPLRVAPAPVGGGFAMEGFNTWGGSVIHEAGTWHMFSARWPLAAGFPDGYRSHGEIVRATADHPEGPYVFQEVVTRARPGSWDAIFTTNPKIMRIGGVYVLYYISSTTPMGIRSIGYATAPAITGPWTRAEGPLAGLGEDAVNPAPVVRSDGSVLLAYRRGGSMRVAIATAPSYRGPFTILNEDVLGSIPADGDPSHFEDPALYLASEELLLLLKDDGGKPGTDKRIFSGYGHGVLFTSTDGVVWRIVEPLPLYDRTIAWSDGGSTTVARRERPDLIAVGGAPAYLSTSCKPEQDQAPSRVIVQAIQGGPPPTTQGLRA